MRATALVALLLLLAGCAAPAGEVKATTVADCEVREDSPAQGVIRSTVELEVFWMAHCDGEMPVVNFPRAIVVYDAWGEQPSPSYKSEFLEFHDVEGSITAIFQHSTPESNCIQHPTLAYPTAVVMLENTVSAPSVSIQITEAILGCPGWDTLR